MAKKKSQPPADKKLTPAAIRELPFEALQIELAKFVTKHCDAGCDLLSPNPYWLVPKTANVGRYLLCEWAHRLACNNTDRYTATPNIYEHGHVYDNGEPIEWAILKPGEPYVTHVFGFSLRNQQTRCLLGYLPGVMNTTVNDCMPRADAELLAAMLNAGLDRDATQAQLQTALRRIEILETKLGKLRDGLNAEDDPRRDPNW